VDDDLNERLGRIRETLSALERVEPGSNPTAEDIANLHEVHARHESQLGRPERAAAAKKRADRARQLRRDT
jgi:transcriptional regulator with XRE-family HTH domain